MLESYCTVVLYGFNIDLDLHFRFELDFEVGYDSYLLWTIHSEYNPQYHVTERSIAAKTGYI